MVQSKINVLKLPIQTAVNKLSYPQIPRISTDFSFFLNDEKETKIRANPRNPWPNLRRETLTEASHERKIADNSREKSTASG